MIMAGHARQKFVCYPISHRASRPGLQRINFVAELRFDTTVLEEREDWNKRGKLEDFLPRFESWGFDWLDVPALIRAAPETFVYPMVDREPLPRWTFGPVTLLGDAAHPMYPIGSNSRSTACREAGRGRWRSDASARVEQLAEKQDLSAGLIVDGEDEGPVEGDAGR